MTRPVHALALALGIREASPETVTAAEAAILLRTTPEGVKARHRRGQMPRPLSRRPLVWSRAAVLAGEVAAPVTGPAHRRKRRA